MYELLAIHSMLAGLLFMVFLFVMKIKKSDRDAYYIKCRLAILKRRLKTMTIVDNAYVNQVERRLKNMMNSVKIKSDRIKKLEDLIYGKDGQKIGIQLPPLDLTASGIFTLK